MSATSPSSSATPSPPASALPPSSSNSPPPPDFTPPPPDSTPPPPPDSAPPPGSPPPPPDASPTQPSPPISPAGSPPWPVESSPPPSPDTPSSPRPPHSHKSPPPPIETPPPPANYSTAPPSHPAIPFSPQQIPSPTFPSNTLSPPNPSNSSGSSNPSNSSGSSNNNSSVTAGTMAGIGFAVAFVVVLAAMVVWCLKRNKKRKVNLGGYGGEYGMPSPYGSAQISGSPSPYAKSPSGALAKVNSSSVSHGSSYPPQDPGLGNSKSWFTYEELSDATNGFSFQNLLGEGGFGCVYKGCLPDGREVAVKQLKIGGSQGEREFQAEVEIISRVHHRHLVSLVGYCISDHHRLLVYDYVPNNTLHYHLHGQGRPVMDWQTRVRVAAGAARGLAYLHEDCHPRIIHRDIKSSNILLDNSFEAQVADFGLAKLTVDTNTHVSTRVMGTFGYLSPEYASTGKLTDRSDVFSFGVMLLEIITGRKPVDSSQPLGQESLVEWARPLMMQALENGNGKFDELPDPMLENNYNESQMFQMIEAAAACVRYQAQMRPRMGRVMRALDNLADSLDLNNGLQPGQSEVFNSQANTEEMRLFQRTAFGSQDYSSDFSRSSWK